MRLESYRLFIKSGSLFMLGLSLLWCTFLFIYRLDIFADFALQVELPLIVSAIIVIATSGYGITIGVQLLYMDNKKTLLKSVLIFSVLFMILQLFLTITPSVASCKCVTWRDAIFSINDWSSIEYAFVLLVLSIIISCKFNKHSDISKKLAPSTSNSKQID